MTLPRPSVRAQSTALVLAIILCSASLARGQDNRDLAPLIAQVDPCVVTITMDHSEGSGFVVDPKGVIVTNYHVIEGAKQATVTFPDKKSFAVEGFLAILPNKDLAVLRIQPGDKQLKALRLADGAPAKGERVFAFGAPMGMSGSVSDGIISAVRPGQEVRDTLQTLTKRDIYKDVLMYDLDATWIQTTAPISPGNSGGPLVNSKGEVVGINTWTTPLGQNLNFSLCVAHVKQLLTTAGADTQPLAKLPAPRAGREQLEKGSAEKTFALWKQLNRLKNDLNEKNVAYEQKLRLIVPTDPRNPMKGLSARNKKKAALFDQMAKTFAEYAAKVKALDNTNADPDTIILTVAEADLAQRTGDTLRQLSTTLTSQSEPVELDAEGLFEALKHAEANLRTRRDVIRLVLNHKYDKTFPTLEETAKTRDADSADEATTLKDSKARKASPSPFAESPAKGAKDSPVRTWTDRSGEHQIQAKYLGTEDGKAKLEKADGKVILVPTDSLSEADRRFIDAAK
jgi:hypothetical protein